MSGILQQGYSFGYVLAACANLGVGGSTESWKTVFWIAGRISSPKSIISLLLTSLSRYLNRRRYRSYLLPRVPTIPRSPRQGQEVFHSRCFLGRLQEDAHR